MLMKKDRSFPLYDLLALSMPEVDEVDIKSYAAAKVPSIEAQKLIHFALGIFWKASIHSWKKEKGKPRINLGRHSEEIRRYLLERRIFHLTWRSWSTLWLRIRQ
jgi:hypothetical protein